MVLKIEIINDGSKHVPPIVAIGNQIFPILDIGLQGEFENNEEQNKKLIYLIKGVVSFIDIFGRPHVIKYEEKDTPELTQDQIWQNRLKIYDDLLKEKSEKNNLKRQPPWFWDNIPKEDQPEWRKINDFELN